MHYLVIGFAVALGAALALAAAPAIIAILATMIQIGAVVLGFIIIGVVCLYLKA